jgi:hypothetical protein
LVFVLYFQKLNMENGNNNVELIAIAALFLPTEDFTGTSTSFVAATSVSNPECSDDDICISSNIQATPPNTSNVTIIVIATATSGKCCPVYTATEELMACKAFIAASEDALVGTFPKGKTV